MEMKFVRWQSKFLFFFLGSVVCNICLIVHLYSKPSAEEIETWNGLEIPEDFTFPLINILDEEIKLKNSNYQQIFLIETDMEKEKVLRNPRQVSRL